MKEACSKCNGTGKYYSKYKGCKFKKICYKCEGSGKVLWIDNIFNKKKKKDFFYNAYYIFTLKNNKNEQNFKIPFNTKIFAAEVIEYLIDYKIKKSLNNNDISLEEFIKNEREMC